jgi:hypothetical protein
MSEILCSCWCSEIYVYLAARACAHGPDYRALPLAGTRSCSLQLQGLQTGTILPDHFNLFCLTHLPSIFLSDLQWR